MDQSHGVVGGSRGTPAQDIGCPAARTSKDPSGAPHIVHTDARPDREQPLRAQFLDQHAPSSPVPSSSTRPAGTGAPLLTDPAAIDCGWRPGWRPARLCPGPPVGIVLADLTGGDPVTHTTSLLFTTAQKRPLTYKAFAMEATPQCLDIESGELHVVQRLQQSKEYGGFYMAPPQSGSAGTVDLEPMVGEQLTSHLAPVEPARIELADITQDPQSGGPCC
jgi:hypothetical protein